VFYAVLPGVAYALLGGSATMGLGAALFTVAAAALLLLLIGIHNAWDNVTYHVFRR
jgi:hypothetical protein